MWCILFSIWKWTYFSQESSSPLCCLKNCDNLNGLFGNSTSNICWEFFWFFITNTEKPQPFPIDRMNSSLKLLFFIDKDITSLQLNGCSCWKTILMDVINFFVLKRRNGINGRNSNQEWVREGGGLGGSQNCSGAWWRSRSGRAPGRTAHHLADAGPEWHRAFTSKMGHTSSDWCGWSMTPLPPHVALPYWSASTPHTTHQSGSHIRWAHRCGSGASV